ncbi:MAG: N-acetyl-alpha-D-glucosaminyl L-malate synthase BshA [Clostridia bacterium]|nr:N-acetyl-alpha-D-glucosaminyl L-malate synthase BshA [Clostridia bacterium]
MTRRPHVAVVCLSGLGGSAVAAGQMADHLARRGYVVHLVSHGRPIRPAQPCPGLTFHPVDVPVLPSLAYPPYVMALASAIARVVREHAIDLVHVHYAVPNAFAAVTARLFLAPERRVPVVTTLQGTDVTHFGQEPAVFEALAWSLRRSDRVTAVSLDLKRRAERRFLLRDVALVPNFVDPAVTRRQPDPGLRRRLAPPDALVLVHASNFRPVKRVVDVIRVLAGVVAVRPAVLLMIGAGPDLAEARRAAEALGVREHVRFLGATADVSPYLSVADVFVLTSESEGCSLAVLEAMASEVPVVATNVGGLPETVEHGRTGFLHAVGDVQGMVESCLRLADPDLRRTFGDAARERVRASFSADVVLPQYERVYEEALTGA